jgi:hypothetical protein
LTPAGASVWALAAAAALSGCDKSDAPPPAPPSATKVTPPGKTPVLPALELSPDARSAVSADGTYTVRWEVVGGVIPDAEPFAIAFAVTRNDGKPVSRDAAAFVDAEMPHHGHGMNFVPTVTRQGGDTFLGEGLLFHMPGRWVLAIDVGEDGIRERTQWFVDVE